ncbi:MAG: DUF945 family protein [Thiolinea sp.]
MKKFLAAVTVLLGLAVIGWLGATFYIGKQTEQRLQAEIGKINQHWHAAFQTTSQLESQPFLQLKDYQHGWLQSEARLEPASGIAGCCGTGESGKSAD